LDSDSPIACTAAASAQLDKDRMMHARFASAKASELTVVKVLGFGICKSKGGYNTAKLS
jgi:hypothetical protein